MLRNALRKRSGTTWRACILGPVRVQALHQGTPNTSLRLACNLETAYGAPAKQKIETQGVLGKARAIPQRSGALILGSRVHTKFFSTSAPIFDNFFKNQCRPGSTTPFWYHQCPPTTPPDAHVSLKSATLVLGGLQPRGQDQCI